MIFFPLNKWSDVHPFLSHIKYANWRVLVILIPLAWNFRPYLNMTSIDTFFCWVRTDGEKNYPIYYMPIFFQYLFLYGICFRNCIPGLLNMRVIYHFWINNNFGPYLNMTSIDTFFSCVRTDGKKLAYLLYTYFPSVSLFIWLMF